MHHSIIKVPRVAKMRLLKPQCSKLLLKFDTPVYIMNGHYLTSPKHITRYRWIAALPETRQKNISETISNVKKTYTNQIITKAA
jgi:hypothetical protein